MSKGAPYVDKLWTALAVDLHPRPRPSLRPVRFDHGRRWSPSIAVPMIHRANPGAVEQCPAAPILQHQISPSYWPCWVVHTGGVRHPGCSRSIGGRSTAARRGLCGTRPKDADRHDVDQPDQLGAAGPGVRPRVPVRDSPAPDDRDLERAAPGATRMFVILPSCRDGSAHGRSCSTRPSASSTSSGRALLGLQR